jgi:hypothetical protein
MWAGLAWFLQFQIQRNSRGGEDNKETQWSFGQVQAVATWVPVIVEFGYVWSEGQVEELNGQLKDSFEVKEIAKETEGLDMARRKETV